MKPRILILDIETSPILAHVWSLWDQNVGLSQIENDWYVLAWAAKWLGDPASKVIYKDQRNARVIENDKQILKGIWKLLDEADVIVTQNGKRFDAKKLNARFIMNGMQPPSSYMHIDTCQIAKKVFGFTSNKLEYMTDKLCPNYKKSKHKKYPGHELWKATMAGKLDAWEEMKAYNIMDVLSTEDLYNVLAPWDKTYNPNIFTEDGKHVCTCGGTKFRNKGYRHTSSGKYKRIRCVKCGSEYRQNENLLSKEKRKSMLRR